MWAGIDEGIVPGARASIELLGTQTTRFVPKQLLRTIAIGDHGVAVSAAQHGFVVFKGFPDDAIDIPPEIGKRLDLDRVVTCWGKRFHVFRAKRRE
jgi:hypothetical protein